MGVSGSKEMQLSDLEIPLYLILVKKPVERYLCCLVRDV